MKITGCGQRARTPIFFAFVCALLGAVPLCGQGGAVVARAASVTGQAVLWSAAAAPLALTPGYILSPGDRIDTRGGGRVVIDLSDGSMVLVAPDTVVTLKDYRMASSLRELFEITLGNVRVRINHFAGKPNPYRMNSPTASIAVRGTEFTVAVASAGDTRVQVIEGLVQVSSRSDPSRSVLLEAGRGVLVPVGQNFRLLGANQPPNNRDADTAQDHDSHEGQQAGRTGGNGSQQPPNSMPRSGQPDPDHPQGSPGAQPANTARNDHAERDDGSPRATASTYDRYLASLTDIGQVPFLLRFNAFSEAHLDSLENPAYAGQFRAPEGRLLFLPTYRGTRTLQEYQSAFGPGGTVPGGYSISPQVSFFAPAGNFTLGGSASFSRVGDNSSPVFGTATTNYYSGSLIAARRFGANSLGIELATLRGSGTDSLTTPEVVNTTSTVTQTRLTLGFTRNLTRTATLGVFWRYGFINAGDHDTLHLAGILNEGLNATQSGGHSSEAGIRLRGQITPRLYYGVTAAWLGISLADSLARNYTVPSHERDRAQRGSLALGLGYALSPRTVLTLDLAGGTGRTWASRTEDATGALLQNGLDRSHFGSLHLSIQQDLTRRLFVSASLLQVWQSHHLNVDLFPDQFGISTLVEDSFFNLTPGSPYASRFSDYGIGWRFTPNLYAQYVYSTDYGVTSATHT
ncbi:MAG: FecR domain-containing protein, partial [Acidobacteriota bacterium]|nr:FecR domain-containing protein [Acidobacteriota bacterium]